MPEEQIVPVGEELFAAIKVVAKEILVKNDQRELPSSVLVSTPTTDNPVNSASTIVYFQLQTHVFIYLLLANIFMDS